MTTVDRDYKLVFTHIALSSIVWKPLSDGEGRAARNELDDICESPVLRLDSLVRPCGARPATISQQ
jgi:hypothetical protein